MDFSLDSEQKALAGAVKDLVASWGRSEAVGPPVFHKDQWQGLVEMGVVGMPYEDGVGAVETALVATELGRGQARTPYVDVLLAGTVLHAAGRSDLVEALGEGTAIVLPALAEPNRAWSLQAHDVTAAGSGDSWTLTGTKAPIGFGDAATHLVVSAVVDGNTALFLVENPTIIDAVVTFDATAATLLTDDAAVLTAAVNTATAAAAAEALGAMDAAVALTVEYLKTRKQFGVPLATFQALTFRAADLYVALELTRSTVQYAAMVVADDPADSATIDRLKVVLGRTSRLVGQEAIQLHGGIGVTAEFQVGHFTAWLTDIEHTYGDTRQHLAALARNVGNYGAVEVLA